MELQAMRVPILAVLSGCAALGTALGTALGGTAAAADLGPNVPRSAIFAPAGQILEWDFEPGVVVRAYWLPPYANRHYFPSSGATPQLGRKENLESSVEPKPAKSFYREWSSFAPEPAGPPPLMAPLPADPSKEPSLK
jgi:hypothetical protein